MPIMATPSAIADDWQEVDGDDFSVVSAPRSEDPFRDGLDSSQGSLVPVHAPMNDSVHARGGYGRDGDLPIRVTHSDVIAPTADKRHDEAWGGKSQDNEVERVGLDTKDVEDPEELPLRNLYEFLDSGDIDPSNLSRINTSLIRLMEDIISLLDSGTHSKIKYECQALLAHLQCLSPVLEGYAKHWDPRRGHSDFPLDPGLESWMSNLTTELLALQAELQGGTDQGASHLRDAKRYEEALAAFTSQMDGLMPVIQEDYSDFHTADLNLVSLEGNDQSSAKAVPASADEIKHMQGEKDLWHLRRELYELKDQVAACITELDACRQDKAASETREAMSILTAIASSYQSIKSSLDIMLSNHASDWIDYSLNGGLTYAEFCKLDSTTVRSLNLQLKDTTDAIGQERNRARSVRYMNDPDNLLEEDATLSLNDALLNGLYGIEEMLTSIFRLRKPSSSAQEGS